MPRARVTKRDAALIRKIKIELREKRAAEQLPPPPHMESGAPNESGLLLITMLATRGSTKNKIAATLGLSARQFKKLLDDEVNEKPTPARLAWEAGFATHESALLELLTERAHQGDSNAALALLRMVHERRDSGPMVNIDQSEKRISITLPGSYSREAYMESVGQAAVIAAEPAKSVLAYQSKPNPADAEMKDVTPTPAAPPASPEPLTPQTGYAVSPGFNRTTPY